MKHPKRVVNIFLLIFMALWFLPETEIEGHVRLVGTSMFPEIVISTVDDVHYYVDQDLFDVFASCQHKTVVLRAKVKEEQWELADGSKSFIRPTIYEAEILEVK